MSRPKACLPPGMAASVMTSLANLTDMFACESESEAGDGDNMDDGGEAANRLNESALSYDLKDIKGI